MSIFFKLVFALVFFFVLINTSHVLGQCTPNENACTPPTGESYCLSPTSAPCAEVGTPYTDIMNLFLVKQVQTYYVRRIVIDSVRFLPTGLTITVVSGNASDPNIVITQNGNINAPNEVSRPANSPNGLFACVAFTGTPTEITPPGQTVQLYLTLYISFTDNGAGINPNDMGQTVNPIPISRYIQVINPVTLSADPSTICAGSNTTLTANSQSQFSYTWEPASTITGSNVGAMVVASPTTTTNYTLTAQSVGGCSFTKNVTVTVSSGTLDASAIVKNVKCFGETNGSIDITVLGGNAPYTFLWSNGSNNEDIGSLAEGTYSVTVSDNSGCSVEKSYVISMPEPLSMTLNAQDASCSSCPDGVITANGSGGAPPYSYSLNGGPINSSNEFTSLTYGEYSVTIYDANNCTTTKTIMVNFSQTQATVWPGDANNDGIVAVLDYFLTASAFGAYGEARTQQGFSWQAYTTASDWANQTNFQGININNKFLDADGNGVINLTDLAITIINRGRTH